MKFQVKFLGNDLGFQCMPWKKEQGTNDSNSLYSMSCIKLSSGQKLGTKPQCSHGLPHKSKLNCNPTTMVKYSDSQTKVPVAWRHYPPTGFESDKLPVRK